MTVCGSTLEQQIDAAYQAGRAAWPEVQLSRDQFSRFLQGKLEGEGDSGRGLDRFHVTDLCLACACLRGDTAAIRAFDRHCGQAIRLALARLGLSQDRIDDAKQLLEGELFLPRGDKPPLLENYAGRGQLRGWVSVVATRRGMKVIGKNHREVSLANDVLDDLFEAVENPELEHLKSIYREEFLAAFEQALDTLTARQRTLLRQRYLDRLHVNAMATIYQTHRTTITRWVQEACGALAEETRSLLAEQLAISPTECESVVRLIRSRLDVTFSALERDR
jgi:RNA polymerase sigma-70 factor (ECF subfamily)